MNTSDIIDRLKQLQIEQNTLFLELESRKATKTKYPKPAQPERKQNASTNNRKKDKLKVGD